MNKLTQRKRLIGLGIGVACIVAVQKDGQTEALPEQISINARSRTNVVGKSSIELLAWDRGIGNDGARGLVAGRLGLDVAAAQDLSKTGGEQKLRGPDWKLTIAGDGTSIRFRRDTVVPGTADRMEPGELTELGLGVIRSILGGIVEVGPGEELVPLRTRYERGGGQAAKASVPIAEVVLSNAIVFGRKVDGIPLVGPGSRVAIIFNSDRTLQAFDVDWPRFVRSGRFQTVVSQEAVWQRAASFSSIQVGESMDLRRMECGYVDLGVRRRTDAPVQVGCGIAYAATRSSSDGGASTTHASVDIIPAGLSVEPDANWPEARILCKGSDICGAVLPKVRAPVPRSRSQ